MPLTLSNQLFRLITTLSTTITIFIIMSMLTRLSSAIANNIDSSIRYRIRKGTTDDIPLIQHCNRVTLPENYDYSYFYNHITTFPDLVYIAEGYDINNNNKSFYENISNFSFLKPNRPLMGYVMGKLEYPAVSPMRRDYIGKNSQSNMKVSSGYSGHVTSLAVNKEYRGEF